MKHLHESIFDTDFEGDFPWLKMKHWEEYYDLLEKMTTRKLEDKMTDRKHTLLYRIASWRNLRDFMRLISEYNTKITSGNYSKNGCYAFCRRNNYSNDDMWVIDFPRGIRISFSRLYETVAIYTEPNDNEWTLDGDVDAGDWSVFKIDPRLIDLIKYVLL